jgi:hypothetical protein
MNYQLERRSPALRGAGLGGSEGMTPQSGRPALAAK